MNVIHLLPDTVANQIAAGEVIQRPASVIKELMENSIDAGATEVNVLVQDAGRTQIQVIDNGCGMNETDARLAFERHATSKISTAQDLYSAFEAKLWRLLPQWHKWSCSPERLTMSWASSYASQGPTL